MDDCRLEFARNSQQIRRLTPVRKRTLPYLSHASHGESHQEKKMEYTQQNDQASMYQSNFRAEDGLPTSRWNALYEGVVIPLASLFAVFLFMVGAMVISH
jgi:hypothetical protein